MCRYRGIGTGAVAGALLAGGLLLGACGDDDGNGADASPTIAVVARDFEFEPDTWTVTAGEQFTVEFENGGRSEHEWAVIEPGEDIGSESEFEEGKVAFEIERVRPGESVSQVFTLEDAGTYQVICALPGHFTSGMEGTLVVE